jgi:branched-chain amino acid transport system ATP-binding protein
MLEVEALQAYYGDSHVLFGVSLGVGEGEVVTLLGRNGMGKTTTVRSIMGIVKPRSGQVRMEGVSTAGLPIHKVARLGIGIVPEGRQVFPNLTVTENLIAMAANRADSADPWTIEKVFTLFPRLRERRDQFGVLLSGGEQQMLAVGRALMTNPRLLILDEATEGLAPIMREAIWTCLRRLKSLGQAILIIDRNTRALSEIADRHYILEKGTVVWSGDNDAFIREPALRERYLGV